MQKQVRYMPGELVNQFGNIITKGAGIPNLDPNFFFSFARGNKIATEDIEKRPYQHHWLIHAASKTIARNVSRVPIFFCEKGNKNKKVENETTKKIQMLFNRPNPFMTRMTFLQNIVLHLLLPSRTHKKDGKFDRGGQSFVVPSNADQTEHIDLTRQLPDTLIPYSDEFFEPIKPKTGDGFERFKGWMFEVPGAPASKDPYLPEEVLRTYQPNPYDFLQGISSTEPCKIAFLQDIKADIHNTNLYDNDAIPAGILSTDDWLNDTQRAEMLKSFYEEFGGVGNARKVAVLNKNLKYDHIGMTQADMQYTEAQEKNFDKIVASFGLNKIALGRYEKLNFATIKEGRRLLWHDTYLPLLGLILESFNSQWIDFIQGDIMLCPDTSEIEALVVDYGPRSKAFKTMVDGGLPASVSARINNIPLTEEDIKKFPWLDERPERNAQGFGEGNDPKTPKKPPAAGKGATKAVEKPSAAEDLAFWDSFVKDVLNPGEKTFTAKLSQFFNGQRNRMQDNVDKWEKNASRAHQNGILPKLLGLTKKDITVEIQTILLSEPDENKALMKIFRPFVADQMKRTEVALIAELGDLVSWAATNPRIDAATSRRMSSITKINTTTFKTSGKKIIDAVSAGNKVNENVNQIAKRIKKAIGEGMEIRKNQAKTIARTETGIVTNDARFEAFREEGIEFHRWVTAGDEKVRVNHTLVNGIIIRVGQTFEIVGLIHPNDPSGPAEEIVNCRCVAVAAKEPE